jgi:SagB-type dehydrogenase family enzyme
LLAKRQSSRSFGTDPLPERVLANLLWAAAGVSRPESGRRTAPTANNRQEVDVYVALASGAYRYEPKSHGLRPVLAKDVRSLTGRQAFAGEAAVNLVFVADYARSSAASDDDRLMYAAAAAGCMSQNVYLYCASEGLATVVRAMIDRRSLGEALNLQPTQKILLAQSVGYPKR